MNGCVWNKRLMIYELQPVILQEKGFFEALETLCTRFQTRYGLEIIFRFQGDETKVDQQTQLVLYRVLQEALHNIVKHAQATKAQVILTVPDTGMLRAKIEDNGVGFDVSKPISTGQFGLAGMEKRITEVNGAFSINSVPGKGTTITVRVPLSPPFGSSC